MTRPISWARRHPGATAVAILAGALCLFFAPLFAGDQLGQSHLLYDSHPWAAGKPSGLREPVRSGEGDAALHYHPILTLAREQLRDGQLPLWNPHSYTGMPLLGDMQSAQLFPLTWLTHLVSVESAFGWMALLKLLLAGVGAYALARRLGVGPAGALVAGLVYELSAPLVLWVQHMLGTELALLPWLLLASDRLQRSPDARGVALLALAVALSIFAGHPETALLNSLAAAIYLAAVAARERDLRQALRTALAFGGAHLLGVAAAAVAVVPFLAAYAESITRVAHGADLHLPPSFLITYLLPNLYGNGEPGYWGPIGYIAGGYFGIAALLLAGVALARRRTDARLAGLAAMAAFMLALAFDVPPVSWAVDVLPIYSNSVTLRVLHAVALAGAVAAGMGVGSLSVRPLPRRAVLGCAAAGLLSVAAYLMIARLAGALPAPRRVELEALGRFAVMLALGIGCLAALGRMRSRALATLAVVLVVAADLWYLQGHNVLLPAGQAYPGSTAGIRFLQRQRELGYASSVRPLGQVAHVLPPNTPSLYGLESHQGYDVPLNRRWADFSWFVLGERGEGREVVLNSPAPRGAALTARRMMNARWYLTQPGSPPPHPQLRPAYHGPDMSVYRDDRALPRAYLVGSTRALEDAAALTAVRQGRLDPRREALVPPGAPKAVGGAFRAMRVERAAPDRIRVRLPPGAAGWLVIAKSYSRQWDARIDGRDARAYPTNFVATGLPVRSGTRIVELSLDRTAVAIGGLASLIGFALIALLVAYGSRTRGREDP